MMKVYQFVRRLTEKGLKDFFPCTTIYSSGYAYDETYEEISIVKELDKLAAESGYEFRLEIYPHHKVCDVVIENNKDCFYQSNIVVSYSLINEKIIGCDISDSKEFPSFTEFISKLVAKYIEPIRGEIEKW